MRRRRCWGHRCCGGLSSQLLRSPWRFPEALAQSSSATVIPQADGNAPMPTIPLDVPDDNYPFDSLLSNEEGEVTLRLVLDGSGHSTEIQLVKSSGFSQLDQRAAQIAR